MSERDFDFAEEMAERERQAALRRLQAAIAADGDGDCEDCGGEIEPARREAVPFARRCIECQRLLEQEKFHR